MTDIQPKESFVEQIKHAHDELRKGLNRFRTKICEQQDRNGLLATTNLLKEELTAHFHLEEADGYLSDAVEQAPRMADKANTLLHQHPKLSQSLDQLLIAAEQGDGSPKWWAEFRTQADDFLDRLAKHEQAENMLVQRAFEVDIGDKD